jgi:protein arginine N-methyltransferase 1
MLIEYHRTMLADHVRNDAFAAALKKLIKPGVTTVADVGAGTGLLGFIAAKLGAKEVYMYESASIMGVAQRLARDNKFKNIRFFNGHSTEALDAPMVDIVISETLGNYAFEENIISTIEDAKRFLKPGGVILPQGLTQYVAPVTDGSFYNELTAPWENVGHGLDYSFARTMGLNNVYVRQFSPYQLLSAQEWDRLDFRKKNSGRRSGEAEWALKKKATVYGLALWWEAELIPGITLSTAPDAPKTHWEQLYFPSLEPINLQSGDTLTAKLSTHSSYEVGTTMKWQLLAKNGKIRQSLDLEKGFLS